MQAVWTDTLAKVDMAAVWARKKHFEEVRTLERSSASAFGVDSVFSTSHLSLSGAYIEFLRVRPQHFPRLSSPCPHKTPEVHVHMTLPSYVVLACMRPEYMCGHASFCMKGLLQLSPCNRKVTTGCGSLNTVLVSRLCCSAFEDYSSLWPCRALGSAVCTS